MVKVLSMDPGIRNFGYVIIEYDDNYTNDNIDPKSILLTLGKNIKLLKWGILNLTSDIENYSYSRLSPVEKKKIYPILCRNLSFELEQDDDFITLPDVVLIESQAKFQETTKLLENIAYGFFSINGLCVDSSPISVLHTQTSRAKQSEISEETKKLFAHIKNSHNRNKKSSIYEVKKIINESNNQKLIEEFKNKDKTDDICDAYLHALSYIRKQVL